MKSLAKIKSELDYLHVSLGHIWRAPLNEPEDQTPIVKSIKAVIGDLPLIGVGSLERPSEVAEVLNQGLEFAAIGRELIREPKWVQKVLGNDEASIRYSISPIDFEELRVPAVMANYLQTAFRDVIHLSLDKVASSDSYLKDVAPMEGYEKNYKGRFLSFLS